MRNPKKKRSPGGGQPGRGKATNVLTSTQMIDDMTPGVNVSPELLAANLRLYAIRQALLTEKLRQQAQDLREKRQGADQ